MNGKSGGIFPAAKKLPMTKATEAIAKSAVRLDAIRQTAPCAECAVCAFDVSRFGFPHISSRYGSEDPVEPPELFDHFVGEPIRTIKK